MCYYDHYRFECGDWKWGNFRVHCEREYRMGEVCGLKMIHATFPLPDSCRLCQSIETKKQRLRKALGDYQRFRIDPGRQATAEVRYREIVGLQREVNALEDDRAAKGNQVGNGRRDENRARNNAGPGRRSLKTKLVGIGTHPSGTRSEVMGHREAQTLNHTSAPKLATSVFSEKMLRPSLSSHSMSLPLRPLSNQTDKLHDRSILPRTSEPDIETSKFQHLSSTSIALQHSIEERTDDTKVDVGNRQSIASSTEKGTTQDNFKTRPQHQQETDDNSKKSPWPEFSRQQPLSGPPSLSKALSRLVTTDVIPTNNTKSKESPVVEASIVVSKSINSEPSSIKASDSAFGNIEHDNSLPTYPNADSGSTSAWMTSLLNGTNGISPRRTSGNEDACISKDSRSDSGNHDTKSALHGPVYPVHSITGDEEVPRIIDSCTEKDKHTQDSGCAEMKTVQEVKSQRLAGDELHRQCSSLLSGEHSLLSPRKDGYCNSDAEYGFPRSRSCSTGPNDCERGSRGSTTRIPAKYYVVRRWTDHELSDEHDDSAEDLSSVDESRDDNDQIDDENLLASTTSLKLRAAPHVSEDDHVTRSNFEKQTTARVEDWSNTGGTGELDHGVVSHIRATLIRLKKTVAALELDEQASDDSYWDPDPDAASSTSSVALEETSSLLSTSSYVISLLDPIGNHTPSQSSNDGQPNECTPQGSSASPQNSQPSRSYSNSVDNPSSHDKKRSFGSYSSGNSNGDGNGDDGDEKQFRRSTDMIASCNESNRRKTLQIPCFVDDCEGSNSAISELIRKTENHHQFYVCTRCHASFSSRYQAQEHEVSGANCEPHCISSNCAPSTPLNGDIMPSERRHRRTGLCPTTKTTSTVDRWQYYYHLCYPDRTIPQPDLKYGQPKPHGVGQRRGQQSGPKQSQGLILKSVIARLEAQIRTLETERAYAEAQRTRLVNIIVACLDLIPSSTLPNYLKRTIECEVPGALDESQQSSRSRTDGGSTRQQVVPQTSASELPSASCAVLEDTSTATHLPDPGVMCSSSQHEAIEHNQGPSEEDWLMALFDAPEEFGERHSENV